jgi:23S rRNA pseudoU1915 N3-methylase RlmH
MKTTSSDRFSLPRPLLATTALAKDLESNRRDMRSMTEMICGPSGVREPINEQRPLSA